MSVRMKQVYDRSKLPENEKIAVAIKVAEQLAHRSYSVRKIVRSRLDPDELGNTLLQNQHEIDLELGTDSGELYRKLLSEAANALVITAPVLSNYRYEVDSMALSDNSEILVILQRLASKPSGQAREFEKRYKERAKGIFNRLVVFGVPNLDEFRSRQHLTTIYVSLDLGSCYRDELALQIREFLRGDKLTRFRTSING